MTNDSVQYLSSLKDLHTLYLSCCGLTDVGLQHISTITSLETLDVSYNDITDNGIKYLTILSNLKYINIQQCRNISDEGKQHFALIPKILH